MAASTHVQGIILSLVPSTRFIENSWLAKLSIRLLTIGDIPEVSSGSLIELCRLRRYLSVQIFHRTRSSLEMLPSQLSDIVLEDRKSSFLRGDRTSSITENAYSPCHFCDNKNPPLLSRCLTSSPTCSRHLNSFANVPNLDSPSPVVLLSTGSSASFPIYIGGSMSGFFGRSRKSSSSISTSSVYSPSSKPETREALHNAYSEEIPKSTAKLSDSLQEPLLTLNSEHRANKENYDPSIPFSFDAFSVSYKLTSYERRKQMHSLSLPLLEPPGTEPALSSRKKRFLLDDNNATCSFLKRPRLENDDNLKTGGFHLLARTPASFRRSRSLRSCEENNATFPTAPAGPLAQEELSGASSTCVSQIEGLSSPCIHKLPIIAPPASHCWNPPPSPRCLARRRLARFMERETRQRERERLPVADCLTTDLRPLGIEDEFRSQVINWMFEVLPDVPEKTDSAYSDASREIEPTLCSGEAWDLYDQLSRSPETRFHAIHLFLRFFHIMEFDENSLIRDDGLELVTWDIALACIALSVKLHRDFLPPLLPVLADHFLALAPHDVVFQDLETAQNDVFAAFSHCLGDTPQAILNELWVALPSLRSLFIVEGWWTAAERETWLILLSAVKDPNVLHFPLSVLTTAACSEAIQLTLVQKYQHEHEWLEAAQRQHSKSQHIRNRYREDDIAIFWGKKAYEEAKGVLFDLQGILNVANDDFKTCLAWLSQLPDCQ